MADPTSRSATRPPGAFVVLCTAPDAEVAATLARSLVTQRLAACVNVVPGLTSHYHWDGRLQEDAELLLLAKTDAGRVEALIAAIEHEHPYECPEAVALPVQRGSARYLDWIGRSLRGDVED